MIHMLGKDMVRHSILLSSLIVSAVCFAGPKTSSISQLQKSSEAAMKALNEWVSKTSKSLKDSAPFDLKKSEEMIESGSETEKLQAASSILLHVASQYTDNLGQGLKSEKSVNVEKLPKRLKALKAKAEILLNDRKSMLASWVERLSPEQEQWIVKDNPSPIFPTLLGDPLNDKECSRIGIEKVVKKVGLKKMEDFGFGVIFVTSLFDGIYLPAYLARSIEMLDQDLSNEFNVQLKSYLEANLALILEASLEKSIAQTKKRYIDRHLKGYSMEEVFSTAHVIFQESPECFGSMSNMIKIKDGLAQIYTKNNAEFLLDEITDYRKKNGTFPESLYSLSDGSDVKKRDLVTKSIRDGWSNRYDMSIADEVISLRSKGKDRKDPKDDVVFKREVL